jgi:hypothetical protein
VMSFIQLFSVSVSAASLEFLRLVSTRAVTAGAISSGVHWWIHQLRQNKNFCHLQLWTEQGSETPPSPLDHSEPAALARVAGSVCRSQSQQTQSAKPWRRRSFTPKPP